MDSNANGKSNQGEVLEWDKKWGGRIFLCLQREVREKHADEAKVVLKDLLDTAHANSIEQMLEYFFDDFMRLLGTDCFLVLQEKCQDHRFLSVLIRKIQSMCQGDSGEATLASLQCSAQQWTAFAAIIVGLEEQDSSLVVSTLEKQLPQLQLMSSDHGECWLSWLRTLCLRLLQDNRIQVLRKILEYFLAHLSVAQLVRLSLLSEFLMATNRSQLFDPEDDNCLKEKQLEQFVTDGNVELFLDALVTLSFEDVPLLLWIRSFKYKQIQRVSKELLIKLCLAVRAIGNYHIRNSVQRGVLFLFKDTIDSFSLRDYMVCIESLFIKGDQYVDHCRLQRKIFKCSDLDDHKDSFNQRSFDIFFHYYYCNLSLHFFPRNLMVILNTLPKHKHGFWRLALYPVHLKEFKDYYRKFYNVDTSLLEKGASLEEMQAHLLDRLDCQTSEETSFLKARCADLFSSNLDSWRQLEELKIDPLELLKQGSEITLSKLTNLLSDHGNRMKDEKLLPALIALVEYFYDMENVLDYAYRNLTEKEFKNCITNLLVQNRLFCLPKRKLSISLYLQLLLHGEPTRGLARIEASCVYYLGGAEERNARIRRLTFENLNKYGNAETKTKVFKELMKINEKLSMEHPHYTENSEVHRQKIRIAFALIKIREYCDDPLSLKTLLLPSDHLGINLMHEFLIGTCVENIDWVLKALPSLQPRLQESYLSVAYIFIFKNLRKLKKGKISEMFTSLQALSMGSCYEVRTLAQIILHRLALECEVNSIHIPVAENLINSVETSLGKELHELQSEPRLMLAEILYDVFYFEQFPYFILDVTNAPFDELHRQYVFVPQFVCNKIRTACQAFRSRKLLSTAQFAPSNNFCIKHSFSPAEEFNSKFDVWDFIVVASLLDKATNFPRLMLICQKFGVDTLVLDEESHLEEYGSYNLRIRRVKPTSLVEFLLLKRNKNYEIHGCIGIKGIFKILDSIFSRRFVLVLGHEELGIPANVNEMLENPVEIPINKAFKRLFAK